MATPKTFSEYKSSLTRTLFKLSVELSEAETNEDREFILLNMQRIHDLYSLIKNVS